MNFDELIETGSKYSRMLSAAINLVDENNIDSREAIRKWFTDVDRKHLKNLVIVGDVHVSERSGALCGVAYVVDGAMPAYKIIKNIDLLGGVSAYPIVGIKKDNSSKKKNEYVNDKFAGLKSKSIYIDTSLLTESEQKGVSLGSINSSIGIYNFSNEETSDKVWYMVIRSFHVPSAERVMQMVRSGKTIKEIYDSPEYHECVNISDNVRDALAHITARYLGATLAGETYSADIGVGGKITCAVPEATGHYNVIQKMPVTEQNIGELYGYYSGCYGYASRGDKAILYGISRVDGWLMITPENNAKPQQIGSAMTAYAFPLGSPRLRNKSREFDPAVLPKKAGLIAHWGSEGRINEKAHPGYYDTTYSKSRDAARMFDHWGFSNPGKKTHLTARTVYISSPSELHMDIHKFLEHHKGKETVLIPINHAFCRDHLYQGFLNLKTDNKYLKLNGDIIEKEMTFYFEMKVEVVHKILQSITNYK